MTVWEGVSGTWIDSAGGQGTLSPITVSRASGVESPEILFARLLDRYGQQGWELVGMTLSERAEHRFFKRPKT